MRVIPNKAQEFDQLCDEYSEHDEQGRDIVILVKMFAEDCDSLKLTTDLDYSVAWRHFLEEHQHQVTSAMVGMIIYVLMTYWDKGIVLFDALPPMEKILLKDTVQDISEEIERRSAENGRIDGHEER